MDPRGGAKPVTRWPAAVSKAPARTGPRLMPTLPSDPASDHLKKVHGRWLHERFGVLDSACQPLIEIRWLVPHKGPLVLLGLGPSFGSGLCMRRIRGRWSALSFCIDKSDGEIVES